MTASFSESVGSKKQKKDKTKNKKKKASPEKKGKDESLEKKGNDESSEKKKKDESSDFKEKDEVPEEQQTQEFIEKNIENVRKRGKKKKKKRQPQRKRLAFDLFTTDTYQPCVHLHFKTERIDRECLTHDQYLEMLATPRGYRWAGEVDCTNPELDINKPKRKKHKKRECFVFRPEAGDVCEEEVETIWDVVTPEISGRLIDFLVTEFGMTIEEAEDFIDCISSAVKHPQTKKKRKKPKTFPSSKHKWVKDFSGILAEKIELYINSMLKTKRTPRVEKIAEVILERFCDLTGENTTLQKPKKKIHRIMVHTADRLALWLNDLMKGIDKPKKKKTVTEEEIPESEQEEPKPEEGKEEEKEKPKEPEEKEHEEPKEEEEKEPDKDEDKEESEKEEEKGEDKEEEKEKEKEPEKEQPKEPEKEEPKEPEKEEPKEPEKEEPKEPEKEEPKEPEKEEPKEPEKEEPKEPEKEEPQEPEKEEPKEPEKEDEKEPEKGDKPEDKPIEEEKEEPKPEEEKTEEGGDEEWEGEEGEEQEDESEEGEEEATEEHAEEEGMERESEEIPSEEEPIEEPVEEPEVDEKPKKPRRPVDVVPYRSPGAAFEVQPKTGSTLKVHKLSSGTVAEVTAQVRGVEIVQRGRKVPVTESPLNLKSAEQWADWASNVADIADEWGKWLESRLTDAEKQLLEKSKSKSDWKTWREQAQTEALKWRVEEERLKDEGEMWGRKLDEKSKKQSETEVKSTDY